MRPLIHIGMPQAGSTFLQEALFPACPNANRLPHRDPDVLTAFYNPIKSTEDFFYSHDRCQDVLRSLVAPDKVTVITHEGLSSTFAMARDAVAARLARLCPDARILIVVRNQITAIPSAYVQRLRVPNIPFVSFRDYFANNIRAPQVSEFRQYYYDEVVSLYEDLFGAASVLVLPFELLRQDPAAFIDSICNFAELGRPAADVATLKRNMRLGKRFIALRKAAGTVMSGQRLLSLWLSLPYNVRQSIKTIGARGRPYEPELTSRDIELLRRAFGASNGRLSARRALDLPAFGYETECDPQARAVA